MVGNGGFWVDVGAGLAKVMATGLSTGVLCSGEVSSNKSVLQIFVSAIGKEGRIREDIFVCGMLL